MKSPLLQFLCCIVFLTSFDVAQDPPPVERPPATSSTLKVDPPKLDFGSFPVGTPSSPQTATLTNTGNETLRIVDITASGIDFRESHQCGETIAAGASCQLQVTFTPATTGPRLGVLSLMVTHHRTPYYMGLTGTGL